jgi:PAS domain S-box-containing protein
VISENVKDVTPAQVQDTSESESRLIQAMRKINQFVQTLEKSNSVMDLCKEAVIFARLQLGAERCGLFLLDGEDFRGTWGTNKNLELVPEADCSFLRNRDEERWGVDRNDNQVKWTIEKGPLYDWHRGKLVEVGSGWVARTAIHSNGKLLGLIFNDCLVSAAPMDPVVQEALAVFGGMLGQMIELQRAREETRRREAEYRLLMEHLPDIVMRYDREGRHQFVSPQFKIITGVDADSIIGKRWRDLPMPRELIETYERKLGETFRSGRSQDFELDLPTARGVRRLLVRLVPEYDGSDPEPLSVLGVLSDVTDQRRAEEALIHSERRYRRAISRTGLIPYERELGSDEYEYMGDGVEELLGVPPEEMTLSRLKDMIRETRMRGKCADMTAAEAVAAMNAGRIHELSADVCVENARGQTIWFADTATMSWDESTSSYWVLGFMQDITDRVKVETDLISSQRRLSLINRVAHSIHGELSLEELLSHVLSEVRSFFPEFRVSYSTLSRDGRMKVLCSRQPSSMPPTEGVTRDCSGIMDEMQYAFELLPMMVNDTRESHFSDDFWREGMTGDARAWLSVPIQHDEQNVGLLTVIAPQPHVWEENDLQAMLEIADFLRLVLWDLDMRQRREASERALQESRELLLQSQKMDAIARLAGGIAHDFNNLLTVISGNIELIADDLEAEGREAEGIEDVRHAIERASSLTSQLLNYGRRQFVQPIVLHLDKQFETVDRLLRRSIREDIEYHVDIESGTWPILADPGQIEQVILNIVVNACEAMPHGGRLSLSIGNVMLDEEGARQWQGLSPGRHVQASISDTGVGIPAEDISRLFEPFFSTKNSPASGLGLASVFGIVKKFNGDIRAESTPGTGTTFHVIFPACAELDKPAAPAQSGIEPQGSESILFVEDEASLLAMASRTLRAYGYRVIEANSPDQALEAFSVMGDEFDMVVTDVVMPGMSGPELVAQLTTQRADLPVLYISGYSDEEMVRRGVERGSVNFMGKPFSPRALGEKVRAILDARKTDRSRKS